MNSADPRAKYIVTSKPGMTPYSSCATLRQARIDSTAARQQGLDGKIRKIEPVDARPASAAESERMRRQNNDLGPIN